MTGKGIAVCDRSGFVRRVGATLRAYTGSRVARDFADITPGFGTRHPQDVNQAEVGGDPTPIPDARPIDRDPKSKQQLCISDREIEAAIRENRAPRRGF
jgi:hypothetical protein